MGFAGAGLMHFTNLPLASRQGLAASVGAEPAINPKADKAMMSVRTCFLQWLGMLYALELNSAEDAPLHRSNPQSTMAAFHPNLPLAG